MSFDRYHTRWYERDGGQVFIVCMVMAAAIAGVLFIGQMFESRSCRVYGEETMRETKYRRFRGGCYVNTPRGWRLRGEVRTREDVE